MDLVVGVSLYFKQCQFIVKLNDEGRVKKYHIQRSEAKKMKIQIKKSGLIPIKYESLKKNSTI